MKQPIFPPDGFGAGHGDDGEGETVCYGPTGSERPLRHKPRLPVVCGTDDGPLGDGTNGSPTPGVDTD